MLYSCTHMATVVVKGIYYTELQIFSRFLVNFGPRLQNVSSNVYNVVFREGPQHLGQSNLAKGNTIGLILTSYTAHSCLVDIVYLCIKKLFS